MPVMRTPAAPGGTTRPRLLGKERDMSGEGQVHGVRWDKRWRVEREAEPSEQSARETTRCVANTETGCAERRRHDAPECVEILRNPKDTVTRSGTGGLGSAGKRRTRQSGGSGPKS